MHNKAKWYVVHTYSGYENKVKVNLEKTIENLGMQDAIIKIQVPTEEVVEIKDDKKRTVMRKRFPGYVIIKMIMTDETWYVVRNTRGVTGFVGPSSKPIPLTDEEIEKMDIEQKKIVVNYEVGNSVRIKHGPLENFIGIVDEINLEKKKIRVIVSMFERETPIELELDQIEVIK
ncbi:MAG: transcription termination/antitermination protein NusG [Clostridiaceae bacterium]|jgi:transcriptional antiterminator NusG|nr:transcription termination/antitermination protein NusG [Clostridiaceae bacterium]